MRTLLLCALIALMPFSGMRVVCVETPVAETDAGTPVDPASECERLCPLHQPPSDDGSDCALSADGLSVIAFAGVAVVQADEPAPAPDVARVEYAESPRFVPEPALPRFGPPPKPQAL
jgi:hypothetical protein